MHFIERNKPQLRPVAWWYTVWTVCTEYLNTSSSEEFQVRGQIFMCPYKGVLRGLKYCGHYRPDLCSPNLLITMLITQMPLSDFCRKLVCVDPMQMLQKCNQNVSEFWRAARLLHRVFRFVCLLALEMNSSVFIPWICVCACVCVWWSECVNDRLTPFWIIDSEGSPSNPMSQLLLPHSQPL